MRARAEDGLGEIPRVVGPRVRARMSNTAMRFESMVVIKRSPSTIHSLTRDNHHLRRRLKLGEASYHTLSTELKSETLKRRHVELALQKSEKHHTLLLTQSRQMQEHLRHLTRKILTAQEDERREISRELHDEIAQTLTGINVRLATLKREAVVNTKGLKGKIAGTQRLVQKSVKIVHRFAIRLRPALLDDLGLIPALNSFITGLVERTNLSIKLITFPGLQDLDVKKRTVFYRVAQEALTNVARHAEAKLVTITFKKRRKSVLMEIKDNGKSFNVQYVLLAKGKKHLGVLGMRERVEMVGGTFRIDSHPGKGTLVFSEIPTSQAGEPKG
jgi:signal transduction histidine kinase